MWIPQGGGAVKFPPAIPQLVQVLFYTDNAQTDTHFAFKHPNGQIFFTGFGSAGGSGFNPTSDSLVAFFPR